MLSDTLDYSRFDYNNFVCDRDYNYGRTVVQAPEKRYVLFYVIMPMLSFNMGLNVSAVVKCTNSYCFFKMRCTTLSTVS